LIVRRLFMFERYGFWLCECHERKSEAKSIAFQQRQSDFSNPRIYVKPFLQSVPISDSYRCNINWANSLENGNLIPRIEHPIVVVNAGNRQGELTRDGRPVIPSNSHRPFSWIQTILYRITDRVTFSLSFSLSFLIVKIHCFSFPHRFFPEFSFQNSLGKPSTPFLFPLIWNFSLHFWHKFPLISNSDSLSFSLIDFITSQSHLNSKFPVCQWFPHNFSISVTSSQNWLLISDCDSTKVWFSFKISGILLLHSILKIVFQFFLLSIYCLPLNNCDLYWI
jgi:hypothetical protein